MTLLTTQNRLKYPPIFYEDSTKNTEGGYIKGIPDFYDSKHPQTLWFIRIVVKQDIPTLRATLNDCGCNLKGIYYHVTTAMAISAVRPIKDDICYPCDFFKTVFGNQTDMYLTAIGLAIVLRAERVVEFLCFGEDNEGALIADVKEHSYLCGIHSRVKGSDLLCVGNLEMVVLTESFECLPCILNTPVYQNGDQISETLWYRRRYYAEGLHDVDLFDFVLRIMKTHNYTGLPNIITKYIQSGNAGKLFELCPADTNTGQKVDVSIALQFLLFEYNTDMHGRLLSTVLEAVGIMFSNSFLDALDDTQLDQLAKPSTLESSVSRVSAKKTSQKERKLAKIMDQHRCIVVLFCLLRRKVCSYGLKRRCLKCSGCNVQCKVRRVLSPAIWYIRFAKYCEASTDVENGTKVRGLKAYFDSLGIATYECLTVKILREELTRSSMEHGAVRPRYPQIYSPDKKSSTCSEPTGKNEHRGSGSTYYFQRT